MLPPSILSDRYLIGTDDSFPPYDRAYVIRLDVEVANVLRSCVHNQKDMRSLRMQVFELQPASQASSRSDVAIIDLAVRLVRHGRLRLLTMVPLVPSDGVPAEVAKPAAFVPMPTSSAPRSAREESVVPSFSVDLDAAALAAVLAAASKDGTPFCEECARAERAA